MPAVKSRLPCLGLELEIDWGEDGHGPRTGMDYGPGLGWGAPYQCADALCIKNSNMSHAKRKCAGKLV